MFSNGHEDTSCQRLEENADLADHENDFVVIHIMKIDITAQIKSPRRIQADGGARCWV